MNAQTAQFVQLIEYRSYFCRFLSIPLIVFVDLKCYNLHHRSEDESSMKSGPA